MRNKRKLIVIITIIVLAILTINQIVLAYGAQDSNPDTILGDGTGGGISAGAASQDDKRKNQIEQDRWQSALNKASESQDSTGVIGNSNATGAHTLDEIIREAMSFLGKATQTTIDKDNMEGAMDTIYNVLMSIAIFLIIAIGMYLGIKFMTAGIEDKAKVKESLIPYLAGTVVVFSAFTIWKLAIVLLRGIA